jgi:hypothetical protein
MRTHDYEQAASRLEMVVIVRPERPQGHFDLARARAYLGDRKRTMAALQQAVTAGFKDVTRINEEKAFDKLRSDPAFTAIVESLR